MPNPFSNGVALSSECYGGITDVVQVATTLSEVYLDISPHYVIQGTEDTIINHLHHGALTKNTALFYRVRLGP